MKTFYKVLAILLGYNLIIACFIVFGAGLTDNVRILDIIVSCIIYTNCVEFLIFPLVNLEKKVHKEVGMMGVHLTFMYTYSFVSIAIMLLGALWEWPFIWQLLLQLGALLILLGGRIATLHVGEKVESVYQHNETLMSSKEQLKTSMETVMDAIALNGISDEAIVNRLNELSNSLRYLSPSNKEEALKLDSQFKSLTADLIVMLRDTARNKDQIPKIIEHLEYLLAKRKTY